jgi:hypothetical protein
MKSVFVDANLHPTRPQLTRHSGSALAAGIGIALCMATAHADPRFTYYQPGHIHL